MNKPTSSGSCSHCQGREKVREAKRWIFEQFQVRNQTGKNCLCALGSDRKLAQNSLHVQNKRENLKKPFKSQKENCQNSKGSCISPKSICLAQLPRCSAGRTGKSSSLCTATAVTGTGRGAWQRQQTLCCVPSSPSEALQAALLGGMPLKLTVHRDSLMSSAVTEAQVCLSVCPLSLSSHAGLSLSLTRNFLKQLLSPSGKPPHRADSGLAPHTSVPSQATKPFVPPLSHLEFQEPD